MYLQNTPLAVSWMKTCISAVMSLGIAIALSGCNKPADTQTPGQKLDSVIGKTEKVAEEIRLQGEQSSGDMKAKTEAAFANAGDALKNATEHAKSSAKGVANTAIDKVDDMAITTAISAELLKDAEIKIFRINVDTKDGAVVLKGQVPNDAVRERASAIAKTFSGVQSVANQLAVKVN
jgi:hyperosmotically inducible protein